MKRRDLLLLLGPAALWPRVARADPRLVCVLWTAMPAADEGVDAALRRGLADAGFAEGPNLAFAARYAKGDFARLPALASELAALKPDLIVADRSIAALAVHHPSPDVPVVALLDPDPVAHEVVQSYARPDGMVTGLTVNPSTDTVGKEFEILRDLMPGLRGIGFMFPADAPVAKLEPTARAAARQLGLAYAAFPVRSMGEVKAAFSSGDVGAMFIVGNPLLSANSAAFVQLAIAAKKPVMTIFRGFTARGFLVSYGPDIVDIWRRLGGYAAKILAGAKPSDLPVEMPSKLTLVINLKTAKALGLTVPQTILARADEVIE